ncbi:MAG: hypothetical protein V7731_01740 [Amphritea sp.]
MFTIEESPADRKRRLNRESKQRQREREKGKNEAAGVKEIRFDALKGTHQAVDELKEFGGFDETTEVMTLMIHSAHKHMKCDPSRFEELFGIKPGPSRFADVEA